MMWICCREKHEDIVRATFDLIQDIASVLPLERLGLLFQKISTIRENEFDEKTVIFLKNYTLNAMKNLRLAKKGDTKSGSTMSNFLRVKKEQKIDESKFYDLTKFWLIF